MKCGKPPKIIVKQSLEASASYSLYLSLSIFLSVSIRLLWVRETHFILFQSSFKREGDLKQTWEAESQSF